MSSFFARFAFLHFFESSNLHFIFGAPTVLRIQLLEWIQAAAAAYTLR